MGFSLGLLDSGEREILSQVALYKISHPTVELFEPASIPSGQGKSVQVPPNPLVVEGPALWSEYGTEVYWSPVSASA